MLRGDTDRMLHFGGRFVLVLAVLVASIADACTVFFLPTPQGTLLARNFDFPAGRAYLSRNGRNVPKAALVAPPTPPLRWVSKYGSLTLNQAGFDFPTEGMNETGLSIAALVWDGSGFAPSDSRPSVSQLQWLQYQLDTQATVQEVVATLSKIPVVQVAFGLHFAVCDRTECAVVEWVNGKPVAYVGKDLSVPALANDGYGDACAMLRGSGSEKTSTMDLLLSSGERFRRAAHVVAQASGVQEDAFLAHAYAGLDRVAQGPFTQWQTLFDTIGRKLEVRRGRGRPRATVDLGTFHWNDRRPGWIDLDAATAKGSVEEGHFGLELPGHYCRDVIAALGSVRATVDPRLLEAIPGYVHAMHPSAKPR